MPFPHHDRLWKETADFIERHGPIDATLLAPDEFADRFDRVYTYAAPSLDPSLAFDWIVIHKGKWEEISPAFLDVVIAETPAVFANEVFVVFSKGTFGAPLDSDSIHVAALAALRSARGPLEEKVPAPEARLRAVRFGALDVAGVREAMNDRYRQNWDNEEFCGYEHPHLWDKARFAEVNRLVAELVGSMAALDVLELGCGTGRYADLLGRARRYLGIDLSDVAIEKARQLHGNKPSLRFGVMDAMALDLPDGAFDLVAAVEIVEHVQDPMKMIEEVHRVLRPGGSLLLNSANRDSLHLRLVRALGLPEFRSTREHFREFGYEEMCAILAERGFDVEGAEGVFLLPYLAVPGIDAGIQWASQDHPELVGTLRELGRLAGPKFGFEFMLRARKR